MDYDLYIVADFIMPTCQTENFDFIQSTPDQSTQKLINSHCFNPIVRKEEFEPLSTSSGGIKYKDNSAFVFGDWKIDNAERYKEMCDIDFYYWKVPKLLKSLPKEVENI